MPAKTIKLLHVRTTKVKGKVYAYFDTGRKNAKGRPIYLPMPPIGTTGFYDSYAALKGARTKAQAIEFTVADLVRQYEKSQAYKDLAHRSQIVYSTSLRKVTEFLGKFPVNDLAPEDVQLVLDDIEGVGAHNNFLAVVGVIYSWARGPKGGRRTTLRPTEGLSKRKGGAHQPWPDEVLEAALECDDVNVRLPAHLLYFTGQRIGDTLAMRWTDIKDGEIKVVQEKTGKTVWIRLAEELRDELARTPKKGFTIIANDRGQRRSDNTVRDDLQAFTAALGVKTVPHGLRKNAVNALLEAGCTVAETGAITGQSYKIVEHYAKQINARRMGGAAILKLENERGKRKLLRKQSQEG